MYCFSFSKSFQNTHMSADVIKENIDIDLNKFWKHSQINLFQSILYHLYKVSSNIIFTTISEKYHLIPLYGCQHSWCFNLIFYCSGLFLLLLSDKYDVEYIWHLSSRKKVAYKFYEMEKFTQSA